MTGALVFPFLVKGGKKKLCFSYFLFIIKRPAWITGNEGHFKRPHYISATCGPGGAAGHWGPEEQTRKASASL